MYPSHGYNTGSSPVNHTNLFSCSQFWGHFLLEFMTTANQINFPKLYIEGPNGFVADVNSSGQLLTGNGVGIAVLNMGPRAVIAGPSGYVANVNTSGDLSTTNG